MYTLKEILARISGENSEKSDVMLDFIIALMPAAFAGVIYFGRRAFAIMLLSVLCCCGFELLYQKIFRKEREGDFSAIVTGMMLAYMYPVNVPYYIVITGSFVASVLIRQIPDGLSKIRLNPVLAARAVLASAFAKTMTTFYGSRMEIFDKIEGAAGKTAVSILSPEYSAADPGLWQLFIGRYKSGAPIAGGIGETCALAILIGFVYLLVRRILNGRITVSFIGTVIVMYLVFANGINPLFGVLSGGTMFAAVFLTAERSEIPESPMGQVLFGVGCGVITCLIRFIGKTAEGVTYAVLIMNIATPLIDKWIKKRVAYVNNN